MATSLARPIFPARSSSTLQHFFPSHSSSLIFLHVYGHHRSSISISFISTAIYKTSRSSFAAHPSRNEDTEFIKCNGDVFISDYAHDIDKAKEAELAVAEFLVESGLSMEVSMNISQQAPIFVQTLIDSLNEIDEFNRLKGGEKYGVETDINMFRKNVIELAKNSSGRELAPFLESAGIPVKHVGRITRVLSSQKLSELVDKVKYLEELTLISNPSTQTVDVLIRRMMKSLSIIPNEDLYKVIAFCGKMEAQRGGLSVLNLNVARAAPLIERFPEILLRTLSGIKSVVEYLEGLEVPRDCLWQVIICFPPVLLYEIENELQPRMRTIKKIGVRARDLGKMVTKYPWILCRAMERNCDNVVSFLLSIKVPKSQVDRVITKCPQILGSSPEALNKVVYRLNQLGVKSKRLGGVIAFSPKLLVRSLQDFDEVVKFLGRVGVLATDMEKLVKRSPEIFASNIESNLQRKIDFLRQVGVREDRFRNVLCLYPEILSMSVEDSLKPRFDYLVRRGLSKREVAFMVGGFPQVLGYTIKSVLEPKLDFLVEELDMHVKEVVKYPRYFSHDLEKKIKPRAKILKNRNIICELKAMLAINDDEFAAQFLGIERMLIPFHQEREH